MSANVFIVSPFLKTILLSRVNKVYLVLFLHVVPRYRQRIWGSWRYHPLESINVCFWQARCPTANHLNSSMEWIDWSWGPIGKAKSFIFIPHLSATHVPQHLSLSAKVLCTIFSFSSPVTLKEDTLGGSIVIFFSYSGVTVLPLWHQWFPMVPGIALFWWSAVLKKIECSASAIICLFILLSCKSSPIQEIFISVFWYHHFSSHQGTESGNQIFPCETLALSYYHVIKLTFLIPPWWV